jgi:hypothetical protein
LSCRHCRLYAALVEWSRGRSTSVAAAMIGLPSKPGMQ